MWSKTAQLVFDIVHNHDGATMLKQLLDRVYITDLQLFKNQSSFHSSIRHGSRRFTPVRHFLPITSKALS